MTLALAITLIVAMLCVLTAYAITLATLRPTAAPGIAAVLRALGHTLHTITPWNRKNT